MIEKYFRQEWATTLSHYHKLYLVHKDLNLLNTALQEILQGNAKIEYSAPKDKTYNYSIYESLQRKKKKGSQIHKNI